MLAGDECSQTILAGSTGELDLSLTLKARVCTENIAGYHRHESIMLNSDRWWYIYTYISLYFIVYVDSLSLTNIVHRVRP